MVTVRYFARLRELAGKSEEQLAGPTPRALYDSLRLRYHFPYPLTELRVAVNDEFAPFETPLHDGDTVAFLPPVSGG